MPPLERAVWRLALARTMAWALLIAGWLALGRLGADHWPLWLGGLAAQTLWLAAIAAGLAALRGGERSASALRWQLALGGGLCVVATLALSHGGPRWALAVLALAWAAVLVSASHAVRLVRTAPGPGRRPPPPFAPALAGAVLAWAVADQPLPLAALLAAGPLLLAALLPSGRRAPGCRAGLFDCALPLAEPLPWRRPADWSPWAARASMLPMMAALPGMAGWCGALGWPAAAMTAAHLAAMLLPPWLLQRCAVRRGLMPALILAMGTGLLCLLLWPGLLGLMGASLCHALAWGLAWRLALAHPPEAARGQAAAPAATRAVAWRPACAVALLGLALAAAGPNALMLVHAALGLVGIAGAWIARHVPASPLRQRAG